MNYTELVAASKAYADRQDIEVSNNMDVFIVMAEARINRVLKTREQSFRSYTTTGDGKEYYALPSDYGGMRDIQLNSALPTADPSQCNYEYLAPREMNRQRGLPYSGTNYYTIIANQIQIYPIPEDDTQTIEIVYTKKVPNINSIDNENWLSTGHPDIYLSGIVAEIELFAKNYDVAIGWRDRMTLAIEELDESDETEKWSGQPLYARVQ